jgi:hypothetical protein
MEIAAADTAGAAEIMRERAALEAAEVWAAADTAVVVAVADLVAAVAEEAAEAEAVVAEDVVVAADVGAKQFDEEKHNENKNKY